ncbi:response regulator [Propionibacteriaceae bacterium G57]|uniref:response regulator n=1 Tax=Aestuariimicrobium sp. G57 TaxID=3418485 RepID=UPI003DA72BC9
MAAARGTAMTVRVLLAEDHPVYRQGLAGLIGVADDLAVVGTCGNGDDACVQAELLRPDVVVMDLNLPGLDGVEATRRICQFEHPPGVLMLSMFDDDEVVFRAFRAGARGYLVKTAGPDEVLEAIRAIAVGGVVFSGALTGRMNTWFDTVTRAHLPFENLTPREREVLALVARGCDNQTVATRLGISPKTVRNLVSNVFAKLQVSDRAQAVSKAREAGLGRTP